MIASSQRFYISGGTLPGDAPSYIRRQADIDLLEGLREGQFCYVLTSRQMGKSSLMVRTANRLRAEGCAVAVLDLTALGQNLTVEQWYYGLLEQLGKHLRLEHEIDDYWQARRSLGPLQRWMSALREVVLAWRPNPVVVFVDEIDIVRSLPFSTDEFFAGIRECYNRRAQEQAYERLTFCLLGVATPSDLIRDTRLTPFNIGRRIELHDFTPDEATPLANGLLNRRGAETQRREEEREGASNVLARQQANRLLQRVLYWTGGHPYLTQKLCQAVAEQLTSAQALSTQVVDRLCEALFLAPKVRDQEENLLFVRERLLRGDVDVAGLLELYGRVWSGKRVPEEETSVLVGTLRLCGIVRSVRGYLRVRNRIYARVFDRAWIRDNMPDAELRRQRAAYRRGVLRTALASAAIFAVIGSLALIAVHQARIAEGARLAAQRQARETRRLLYASDMNVAQQALDANMPGRASELLQLYAPQPGQEDLRTFEWRYLWRRIRGQSLYTFPDQGAEVVTVAYSPDGSLLATINTNGDIKLWDTVSKRELTPLPPHKAWAGGDAAIFSPDGKTIAALDLVNPTVHLWDVATRRETSIIPVDYRAWHSLAFSPDGRWLAIPAAAARRIGGITLWDVAARRKQQTFPGLLRPSFSRDGRWMGAINGEKGSLQVWAVRTQRKRAERRMPLGDYAQLSPDGKTIAVAHPDYTISLWDSGLTREIAVLKGHSGAVYFLAFSPDGRTLASTSADGTLRLWDIATHRPRAVLRGHHMAVFGVAFSPDGKTVATAGKDGTVNLWDAGARDETELLPGTFGAALSPDGRILATGSDRSVIRLWDTTTLHPIGSLRANGDRVAPVGFSSDSRTLFALTDDANPIKTVPQVATVRWWDVASRREIGALPKIRYRTNQDFPPGTVTFSADGKTLATQDGYDGSVELWDVARRRPVTRLKGHEQGDSIALFPDGRTLVAGYAGVVRLWDKASRKELRILQRFGDHSGPITFSRDGRLLAVTNELGQVWLWDTGSLNRPLFGFTAHNEAVSAIAFSPDGQTLATGGLDGLVKLWNVKTRRLALTLKGHSKTIYSLAFSPDGNRLYSGSEDGTVRVWRASPVSETDRLVRR